MPARRRALSPPPHPGQREFDLLHRLSRCANPRLGLEHSQASMLRTIARFFDATSCHLERPGCPSHLLNAPAAAGHLLCVEIPWRTAQARLQLSRKRPWSRHELAALGRLARPSFALLERIEDIERLSAQAAERERQRLALDLHDSALQPYLGLKMAIEALCLQAQAGRPILRGLKQLLATAERVIGDLRGQLQRIGGQHPSSPQALLQDLRQQARHTRLLHGLEIAVDGADEPALSPRLHGEVTQMVREGLSNICRHTSARTAEVQLQVDEAGLALRIANEGLPTTPDFVPRSISQRAQALGGWAQVHTEAGLRTAVHVHIPL